MAAGDFRELQLEVLLNDTPTKLIGSFMLLASGRFAVRRSELAEMGLKTPAAGPPEELVVLDDLPGISYRYDEPSQRISIQAGDESRTIKNFDASGRSNDAHLAKSDYGGVLNFTLFGASAGQLETRKFAFSGASATLDARAFTPFGTLSQSAILRTAFDTRFDALRLDTSFAYSDPQTLMTYRAGDTITRGLAWTRPIRIGGVQVQRDFSLRPDLVTLPLPSVSGSAAVPSTVDVYVNNLKTFSKEVGTGPYQLTNIPVVTGGGTARVVLRDSAGREVETNLPFYASSDLLAPGLTSFSFEAGLPRVFYGTTADTYARQTLLSASARRGMFDWMTVEGHAEVGGGLMHAGGGAVVGLASLGIGSMALAASHYGNKFGLQSYLSYETKLFGMNVQLAAQNTFGDYEDLASVTARMRTDAATRPPTVLDFALYSPESLIGAIPSVGNTRPPKAMNRLTVGMPLPFDRSSLSASFIHLHDAVGTRSNIVTASVSQGLPYNTSLYATAFSDFGDRRNTGFFVGLSMPLGGAVTASTSVVGGSGATSVSVDAAKPLDQKPGSYGWRVRASQGDANVRFGAAAYRSAYGRAEASVGHDHGGARATAEVEGAVATLGGGVFLANRIDDAFAVVNTGVPNVEVFHENRPVAVTDASGRALVPGLISYQKNNIAIDARNLPLDADVDTMQSNVVPAGRSGVYVKFAVQTNTNPAILVLTGADGNPLPAGAPGQLVGGESFVVGYDGRAYVKGLAPENTITVKLDASECRASFSYAPRPNEQVVISPIVCR